VPEGGEKGSRKKDAKKKHVKKNEDEGGVLDVLS
jgi:hypothetical protein